MTTIFWLMSALVFLPSRLDLSTVLSSAAFCSNVRHMLVRRILHESCTYKRICQGQRPDFAGGAVAAVVGESSAADSRLRVEIAA